MRIRRHSCLQKILIMKIFREFCKLGSLMEQSLVVFMYSVHLLIVNNIFMGIV